MDPIATIMLSLAGLGLFLMASGFAARKRRKARRAGAAVDAGPQPDVDPALESVTRRVEGRMAAIEAVQAELTAKLDGTGEDRLQAMAAQLLGLIRDKNATLETALAGLDQLRARMKTLEQMGSAAEARGLFEGLTSRLDALESAQAAAAAALEAGLAARRAETEGPDPQAALVEQLTKLHAQKDSALAAVIARLAPLESRLGGIENDLKGREPVGEAVGRLESRLEAKIAAVAAAQGATGTALAALEAAGTPVTELAQHLGRLHAQKDTIVEGLLGRIAALETELAGRDPKAVLDGFAARLDALQSRLDMPAENPFAEISEQLTRLYAQKDATTEAVLARLAPLEAKLAEIEGRDPRSALDGFAARLDALQSRLDMPAENPFAEISEQLTRLYAQKDATTEAVLARLAPLEAKLAEIEGRDPRSALDGFAARLDALQSRLDMPAENPFAEISEQLTRLYAQKDATTEAVLARLAPLEAKLAEIEGRDPRSALDGFAARLDALQSRLDMPAENPFAEISEQLTRLYAQKDATTEAVLARLAPLEAKLAEIEGRDPRSALDGFAARLDALQSRLDMPAENPFAEISEQLTRLYAQKDATTEAVLARLAPLEAKLAEIEGRDPRSALDGFAARLDALHGTQGEMAAGLVALEALLAAMADGPDAEKAARAEARAIAEQLAALKAAATQTELFADRLAVLEASLPRLNAAQSQMMRALERQAGGREAVVPTAPEIPPANPFAAFRELPRIVSLHQK